MQSINYGEIIGSGSEILPKETDKKDNLIGRLFPLIILYALLQGIK